MAGYNLACQACCQHVCGATVPDSFFPGFLNFVFRLFTSLLFLSFFDCLYNCLMDCIIGFVTLCIIDCSIAGLYYCLVV